MFGVNWKPILTLHKVLTVSRKLLLEAFFKEGVPNAASYQKLDSNKKLVENLRTWVNLTLF